ncbi:MAG TPA: glycosyltransferase family 2 protein, partial [Gaiellaceae bacterium]|nr:glycosyltransferase family 2 protein [Gaiellaceae bacterium]
MAAVSVVVVTYNALPWIERSLESVRGRETIVVDHGSTDGTLEAVQRRFPDALILRRENRGYGAGLNAGLQAASREYVLLLNSDAWAEEGAVDRLLAFAEAHPRAGLVGPRGLNPDGTRQLTVRAFPTLWRLATEYLFLRKLAPRSRALNSFYAGGLDLGHAQRVDWVMGFAMLVRREAVEQVGSFDESFFMFSEETDLCRRLWDAGWEVWYDPEAEFTHVAGATHGGRMFDENVRGHLRYLKKHRGE